MKSEKCSRKKAISKMPKGKMMMKDSEMMMYPTVTKKTTKKKK